VASARGTSARRGRAFVLIILIAVTSCTHSKKAAGPTSSASTSSTSPSTASSAAPSTSTPTPEPTITAAQKKALQAQINAILKANRITFQPNSEVLSGSSIQTVLRIVALLRALPGARIEVDGHVAKADGVFPHTRTLSTQRANRVRALMIQRGIDHARITTKGYGDTKPIASNDTPEGQALNRRVEIIVL
jgi:outer membrane protein OmpA-like peptidoglycan-associated protein